MSTVSVNLKAGGKTITATATYSVSTTDAAVTVSITKIQFSNAPTSNVYKTVAEACFDNSWSSYIYCEGTSASGSKTQTISKTVNRGASASSIKVYVRVEFMSDDGSADAGPSSSYATVSVPIRQYTATYKPNGASGSDQTQTYNQNSSMTTKAANTYSLSGYTFKRWNTSQYDTGAGYNASTSYTPNANLTLYAIWERTVTLDVGDHGSAQADIKTVSTSATVLPDVSDSNGWKLLGWSETDGGSVDYSVGASYSGESATLYAVWERWVDSVTIGNATVIRTEDSSSTTESDAGAYAYVQVPVAVSGAAAARISLSVKLYDDSGTLIATVSGTTSTKSTGDASVTPTLTARLSGLGTDSRYDAKCIVSVSNTSYPSQSVAPVSKTLVIPIAMYTIAAKPGGHGVAFGAPSTEDGAKFGFPVIGEVKQGSTALLSRACYPIFVYSAFPTNANNAKDESQLPITPCFVHDTSDGAFYFCDGQ